MYARAKNTCKGIRAHVAPQDTFIRIDADD